MVLMAMLLGFVGYTMVYSVVNDQNWKFWNEWSPSTATTSASTTAATTPASGSTTPNATLTTQTVA